MSTFIKLAQPVSQSGDWIVTLAANPTIDIGTIDQGTPGADAWPMYITDGTYMAAITPSLALKVDGSAVVQPVSVSGTVPISGSVTILGTMLVSGPVTDAQLRASALPISGNIGVSSLPSIPAGSNAIGAVSVSNFPATQPVSIAAMPSTPVTGPLTDVQLRASAVPVSSASLPLPAGAATAAKQPALGVAGNASSDVLTVQGVASMTPLKIDGSGVTQPVSGTFWQATQPVSGTVTSNIGTTNGLSLDATLSAMSAKMPATLGQKLMASSLSVAIASDQGALPISGTVGVSGTIAVSGTVTANAGTGTMAISAAALPLPAGASTSALQTTGNTSLSSIDSKTPALGQALMAASRPVVIASNQAAIPITGTFWQSTQPVSIASMPSTPVTGTFWQATQPVSGSVSVSNFPASQAVTNAGTFAVQTALNAETTKIIGTVNVAASQSIDITNAAAVAKGTQGVSGVPTQALKDSGRNQTNFFMAIQIVSTAVDTLLSLTGYKGGLAVVATTTPAVVTAGKKYRITSITLTYVTIVTTPGAIRFTLRANTGGTVLIGSPAVINWTVGEPSGAAPVAGKFNTVTIPFPEGLEFAAGTGIGLSQVGLNTVGAAAAVGYGIASVQGYEY